MAINISYDNLANTGWVGPAALLTPKWATKGKMGLGTPKGGITVSRFEIIMHNGNVVRTQ